MPRTIKPKYPYIKQDDLPLLLKIPLWVVVVWFGLFVFMWAGYLLLTFLGLIPQEGPMPPPIPIVL